MSNEIIIALLAIGFIGSLAVVFILWSKLDEQKKLTQEERDRRWDEISLRLTVEKEKDAEIAELNSYISDEINDYNKAVFEKGQAEEQCEGLKLGIEYLTERNDELQDRLSALLCPTNNHVWKDGCCVKCGRVKK